MNKVFQIVVICLICAFGALSSSSEPDTKFPRDILMTTLSTEFLGFSDYPESGKHCRARTDEEFYRFCALVLIAKRCKQHVIDFELDDEPFDSIEDCAYFKRNIDYLTAEIEKLNDDCGRNRHIESARVQYSRDMEESFDSLLGDLCKITPFVHSTNEMGPKSALKLFTTIPSRTIRIENPLYDIFVGLETYEQMLGTFHCFLKKYEKMTKGVLPLQPGADLVPASYKKATRS